MPGIDFLIQAGIEDPLKELVKGFAIPPSIGI